MARESRSWPALAARLAFLIVPLPVVLVAAPSAHADQWRDKEWHLDFLKADEVNKITKGAGVTVAVVDSGVDGTHPDLTGNVLKGVDIPEGGNGWRDVDGHGTAMASLIAGHGHGRGNRDGILGLAPQAKILPIRGNIGTPAKENPVENTIKALDRAVNSEAKVISFSAKAGGTIIEVETALARDIVFVASAGNSEATLEVTQPASYPGVVAVSGVDRDGNFTEASVEGPEVVLAAPAVDITAAGAGRYGEYSTFTANSRATALVSATAALIRAKYPDLSANGVINRLIKTADDKGSPGRDPKYGFGVVNPLKALTADIPDINYNPLIGPTSATPTAATASASASDAAAVDDGGDILTPVLVGVGVAVLLILGGVYVVVRRRRASRAVHGQYHQGWGRDRPQ